MGGEDALQMTAPAEVYRRRRGLLAGRLRRPLVVCAGYAPARNYAANPHPFRAGSTYLYLGGPPVEGAAWIIEPASDGAEECKLLRPEPGADDELWLGGTPSDAALAAAAGIAESAVVDAADLLTLLSRRVAGVIAPPCVLTQAAVAAAGLEPAQPDELLAIIDQRLIKDEHELRAMRRAAEVTVEAHRAAMAAAGPRRGEADVAAAFMNVLVTHECQPSFTPIATVRGEVLHGQSYPNRIEPGSLVVVDAGAEEPGGYACDVTRTCPGDGSWTPVQRHIYDTVLRAHDEAVAACVPGRRFREVHDLAGRVICEGLVQADLLRGDPAELAARYAHTLFFCHGLGHLIGLDAHDMEDFGDLAGYAPGRSRRSEFGNKFLRLDRDLEPGMTVTIEPGVYLVPAIWKRDDLTGPFNDAVNKQAVDALLKDNFGGIRIEDTICVGESGVPENLTQVLPTDPDAVAGLVGSAMR
jgi:Xaa-Pro aminopeptidase